METGNWKFEITKTDGDVKSPLQLRRMRGAEIDTLSSSNKQDDV